MSIATYYYGNFYSLSLSLSLYIYIYIYIYLKVFWNDNYFDQPFYFILIFRIVLIYFLSF